MIKEKVNQNETTHAVKVAELDGLQVPLALEHLYNAGNKLLESLTTEPPISVPALLGKVDDYVNEGIGWCISFEEQHNPEKVLNNEHIPDELILAMAESDRLHYEIFGRLDDAILKAADSLFQYYHNHSNNTTEIAKSWTLLNSLCPEFCDRNKSIKYYPICFQAFCLDFLLSCELVGKNIALKRVQEQYLHFIDYQLDRKEQDTVARKMEITQNQLNSCLLNGLNSTDEDVLLREQLEISEVYWRGFYMLLSQYSNMMVAVMNV